MLVELHIESMGVIDRATLVFGPGLTALTGETGAGKTMLVEAIALLLGGRADPSVVRTGCAEARIEGRFVVGESDGDGQPDEYVVARVIPADGRSRTYINGRLATVANLAELTGQWVDLHGQHAHHGLLEPSTQRDALDRWAAIDLSALRAGQRRVSDIDAQIAALGGDARTRAQELDMLQFQAEELAAAQILDGDEDSRLAIEFDTLTSALDLEDAGRRAVEAMRGDGRGSDAIGEAIGLLGHAPAFAPVVERLTGLLGDLDDVVQELRSITETIEENPQRLDEVRQRRQLLRDLQRKYGDTLGDVLDFQQRVDRRLAELNSHSTRLAALEAERAAAIIALQTEAAAVGARRREAAGGLAAATQARLRTLAMPHAEVVVDVGEADPGDQVAWLFTANPGSALLPLTKAASGGELARAMLAVRLELSAAPDTLVFDEVDAGIGGQAAQHVATALAELGKRHQVLVVTHLAQVAAAAETQLLVSKYVETTASGDRVTATSVTEVSDDERVAEIARLLSGNDRSAAAKRHAAELLDR